MPSIDRLSALLEHFHLSARLSFSGSMCGKHVFAYEAKKAYLHVFRSGSVKVRHPQKMQGVPAQVQLNEPSFLFYPRPLTHQFINSPDDASQFVCAEIDFQGGNMHPIVQALPSFVLLPLSEVDGLEASLNLLFAETGRVRCGHKILADRLFEVVLIQLLRWLLDHPAHANINDGLLMGLTSPQIAKALTAMHESPGLAWTIEQLAETSGMSRTAFAIKFKKLLGTSPGQYLADWRLALVQARLKEGITLKALALELGYSSQSALTRVFSQRLGVSPRQWLSRATPVFDKER